MKIIQVHNYYQQAGGEDAVVAAERLLLEDRGNIVVPYYKTNDDISIGRKAGDRGRRTEDRKMEDGRRKSVFSRLSSVIGLLRVSAKTLLNHQTYCEFRKLLQQEKPDIVHSHNTFPLISPSIYWACATEKVPVVQTLHNYRMLCLNAFLFRSTNHGVHQKPRRFSSFLVCRSKSAKVSSLTASPPSSEAVVEMKSGPAGSICELCVSKKFKWPGIKYGCYRESKAGSLVVALMLFFHKMIGTWSKKVTGYIALTEFQKQKMIEGGFPEDKIWVKPNFIQRTEVGGQRTEDGYQKAAFNDLNDVERLMGERPYALFVGRLSPEKGCDVLIRAWALFQGAGGRGQGACGVVASNDGDSLPLSSDAGQTANNQRHTVNLETAPQLLIVGDGPQRTALESMASGLFSVSTVRFLGQQPKEHVLSLMHGARFLVLPSIWYEGFPMTIVESFACGTAVVASDDGGMREIIVEGKNGLKFAMSNSSLLATKLSWAFTHPEEMREMGEQARKDFEEKYSASANYHILMDIYNSVSEA